MSSQSSVSLLIECRPSRQLLSWYLGLTGAAALGIVISDIPPLLQVVCSAVLACGAASILHRHILLLNPDSVVAAGWSGEQWTIHTRDGGSRPAQLEAAAFWMFDIIPLVFECGDGKRHTVLLAPDSVHEEPFRRLRAWIRHRMPAA